MQKINQWNSTQIPVSHQWKTTQIPLSHQWRSMQITGKLHKKLFIIQNLTQQKENDYRLSSKPILKFLWEKIADQFVPRIVYKAVKLPRIVYEAKGKKTYPLTLNNLLGNQHVRQATIFSIAKQKRKRQNNWKPLFLLLLSIILRPQQFTKSLPHVRRHWVSNKTIKPVA